MKANLGVLGYLWAAPASALGLLVAGIAVTFGARVRWVEGVMEVAGGRLVSLVHRLPLARRFSAITLGHVIVGVTPELLTHVRAHEHVHVRQYERWGVFFFPLYAAASVVAGIRTGAPYWHNHFERQARHEADAQAPANDGSV